MARPIKWRQIESLPETKYFIPSDRFPVQADRNVLKIEELEAVRLKDLEGLEQDECAEKMQVSRPTFRRILISAREKIADSLVNGKAISIQGGNFTQNICPMRCSVCGHLWDESYERIIEEGSLAVCPKCGSDSISCVADRRGHGGRRGCGKCQRGMRQE